MVSEGPSYSDHDGLWMLAWVGTLPCNRGKRVGLGRDPPERKNVKLLVGWRVTGILGKRGQPEIYQCWMSEVCLFKRGWRWRSWQSNNGYRHRNEKFLWMRRSTVRICNNDKHQYQTWTMPWIAAGMMMMMMMKMKMKMNIKQPHTKNSTRSFLVLTVDVSQDRSFCSSWGLCFLVADLTYEQWPEPWFYIWLAHIFQLGGSTSKYSNWKIYGTVPIYWFIRTFY